MEVIQSTFYEKLPSIKTAIDNATFLAIDCELTGLQTNFDINAYDTPRQYYEKLRKNSADFLIIQFGLCAFRYEESSGSFKYQTYNFYIFPNQLNWMVPDNLFQCQASSIRFLIKHGFDFNKLFSKGITFMNKQAEDAYRLKLEKKKGTEKEGEEEIDIDKMISKALGFTELMQYISQSEKLIVGHNMLLDVCHITDKFLTKLPTNFDAFKECIHCLFPRILDTKYIATSTDLKSLITSSVLGQMYSTLTAHPFKLPVIESGFAVEDGIDCGDHLRKEHEAGYDAYITGVSLISMWKYLATKYSNSTDPFQNVDVLKPFMNKIYLMRLQDSNYLQLDGQEPEPSRDHVCYLTFPKEWRTNDIVELFSPFGNIVVAWINDSSAYVGLHNRDQAEKAFATIAASSKCTLIPFARRQLELHSTTSVVNNPRKRKASFSSQEATKQANKSDGTSPNTSPICKTSKLLEDITVEAPVPCVIQPRKRSVSKTFTEDSSWE